ncbi:reverse transcriptase domain-containing protein [Tanacetum coccineum]
MWESAKTVAPTPNSAIVQIDVDDNFVINNTHLNMIRENKFDGYLQADPHDHIREFLAICDMFKYGETQSEAVKLMIFPYSLSDKAKTWFNELNEKSITSWDQMRKAMDSQIISLNEELQDIRNKYNKLRKGNTSKNNDTPMCEHHEANFIRSEDHQNQISHDSYSRQSLHDPNDSEKSLTELNNDVRKDLKDFKRCVRSMRTVHDKLYDRDDGKTTDMILKMKQNEKNFQTIFKNMERKMNEWSKSQNISSEQTDKIEPQPPPQAHTEQVNVVFTRSGKSADSPKTQKDPPPPIIVDNKTKKDKPNKTTKKAITW